MHRFLPNANANCQWFSIYRGGRKQQLPQERECISVTTFGGQPQYIFNLMNVIEMILIVSISFDRTFRS